MKEFDVIIIGGGVTGTAILFALSNYTNIKKIALTEKYSKPAQVNSANWNNSQTLHFGDIETNYSYEKAVKVKEAAEMVKIYLNKYDTHTKAHNKTIKMVLAINDKEVMELEKRYKKFKKLFPHLKKLYKKDLRKIEPNILKDRKADDNIMALASDDGYAVDFGKLSESFVKNSLTSKKEIGLYFNNHVKEIKKLNGFYIVRTNETQIKSKVVMVAAGSHSLIFAKKLGYAEDTILLPVAGNFYTGRNLLHNKVYTLQQKKLPFAAVHGDPEINDPSITRFGPTAKVIPVLERHKTCGFRDFLKMFELRIDAILALIKIISDPVLFRYILKNFMFDIPFLGKLLFLKKEVRKIVPSAKLSDIYFANKVGGIRPQVVDVKKKTMDFGTAEFIGDNIIFNITPSPGASTCLKNAEEDTLKIIKMFGKKYKFDSKKFNKDFKKT